MVAANVLALVDDICSDIVNTLQYDIIGICVVKDSSEA